MLSNVNDKVVPVHAIKTHNGVEV